MATYGIWKARCTQNVAGTFEERVRSNSAPVLFASEMSALEAKHDEEMKDSGEHTEFEVRLYKPKTEVKE